MKGLSPLIASVFLIAIALTAATILSGWTSSFASSQTTKIQDDTALKIKCSNAGLAVDNVRYNCSSGKISLDAYNSGQIGLSRFKFLVILNNTSTFTFYSNNETLDPGVTTNFYNSTGASGINLSLRSPVFIDRAVFLSETCPLTSRNEKEGSKITADGC